MNQNKEKQKRGEKVIEMRKESRKFPRHVVVIETRFLAAITKGWPLTYKANKSLAAVYEVSFTNFLPPGLF